MPAKKPQKSGAALPRKIRKLKSVAERKERVLTPRDSVAKASKRMRKLGTKTWPVAEGRKLVGVVDQPDSDVALGGKGHDPCAWRVGEIMKRQFVYCFEEDDCNQARRVMDQHGLRYLPVVDRDMKIIGIFERGEIEKAANA